MDCSILSIVDPENREVNIDMGFWKEVHVLGMWVCGMCSYIHITKSAWKASLRCS